MESWSRINYRHVRLAMGEVEVQKILKEFFEDLYNIDTQEQDSVHIYGFDGAQRGNYFEGETIRRTEQGSRVDLEAV